MSEFCYTNKLALPFKPVYMQHSVCLSPLAQRHSCELMGSATQTHQRTNAHYGVSHLCRLQRQLCVELINKSKKQCNSDLLFCCFFGSYRKD